MTLTCPYIRFFLYLRSFCSYFHFLEMFCFTFANQEKKVQIQSSSHEEVKRVIFIDEQFASGGELIYSN